MYNYDRNNLIFWLYIIRSRCSESVMDEHFLESCNYDEKIRQLFQKTKIQKSVVEINQILDSLSQSLERCLENFKLLQQEEPGSGKSVLYQTDLETEIAYQLVLGSSKRALERRGLKKDPLVMEKEKWKFLEEATCSYLNALKGKGEILCPYGN